MRETEHTSKPESQHTADNGRESGDGKNGNLVHDGSGSASDNKENMATVVKNRTSSGRSEQKAKKSRVLGAHSEFYLIYLLFYFVPWLFQPPDKVDITVAIISVCTFIPLYLYAYKHIQSGMNWKTIAFVFVCLGYAYATGPFLGTHGTFYIYAIATAGFLRPRRSGYILMGALVVLYLPIMYVSGEPWYWTAFTITLSLMVGIGSAATAAQEDREASLTRSRDLDSHLAALGERERIARDLHDLLGHTLTMVALKAELAEKLIDTDPVRSRQELTELRDVSRRALKNVRSAISGMHMTTLHSEIERATEALATAGVSLEIFGTPPHLDEDTSQTLGLVIREAVTNIVRHSLARKASISFERKSLAFEIIISDNGTGDVQPSGSGLRGLRRRVEALDGELLISNSGGTTLNVTLPNDALALTGDA